MVCKRAGRIKPNSRHAGCLAHLKSHAAPPLTLAVILSGQLLAAAALPAQENELGGPLDSLGIFEADADVGQPAKSGSAVYDPETQDYYIRGAGANMWFDRDEFHLVWRRLQADFILRARARFLGQGVNPHRKLGWIIRSGLTANGPQVSAVVHGDGLTSLQFRRKPGTNTEEVKSPLTGAEVIQLERKGTTYTLSVACFGDTFTNCCVSGVELGEEVYAGLFVCSHDKDVVEEAVFQNVRIVIPAPDNYVPYRDYLGSNLEILDVTSGHRTIVHRSPDSLQAPNWTRDGRALIYNSRGLLFRFDLARKTPTVLKTGFCTANNNDHVLSFDGRWLGISHHRQETGGRSLVYVVPSEGGEPRLVTPQGPSYLHGWSPDGRFLVYTGERNGEFDIYRIPVEGGQETRLTSAPGLDDGPEYSPDGRHIYFNSVRSGTMQLWRMRADGSRPEQLTRDEYNNWFPHVSPDGQWIAFLSFPGDIKPSDHPFYQRVYLRLMPAAGGAPKVIAYLYGGQGTINVPSWAPDSRRLAFVSNTDLRD